MKNAITLAAVLDAKKRLESLPKIEKHQACHHYGGRSSDP